MIGIGVYLAQDSQKNMRQAKAVKRAETEIARAYEEWRNLRQTKPQLDVTRPIRTGYVVSETIMSAMIAPRVTIAKTRVPKVER